MFYIKDIVNDPSGIIVDHVFPEDVSQIPCLVASIFRPQNPNQIRPSVIFRQHFANLIWRRPRHTMIPVVTDYVLLRACILHRDYRPTLRDEGIEICPTALFLKAAHSILGHTTSGSKLRLVCVNLLWPDVHSG